MTKLSEFQEFYDQRPTTADLVEFYKNLEDRNLKDYEIYSLFYSSFYIVRGTYKNYKEQPINELCDQIINLIKFDNRNIVINFVNIINNCNKKYLESNRPADFYTLNSYVFAEDLLEKIIENYNKLPEKHLIKEDDFSVIARPFKKPLMELQ